MISEFIYTFILIAAAEFGDKSQLVCIALAIKYRVRYVVLGAIFAFMVLNLLAVTVGSLLRQYIPYEYIAFASAVLFIAFGVKSFMPKTIDDECDSRPTANILLLTFSMIFISELGDKTQIAVTALSTKFHPFLVWVAATAALTLTSITGVYIGKKISKRYSAIMHSLSGILFLLFGLITLVKIYM
jgi:Ca2+/H+ antiporter, TMEM165/GDT1 family